MSVKVDVGTPTGNIEAWATAEVRFHGFANLTTVKDEHVESPIFTCHGHEWKVMLYPGGNSTSIDGMIGAFLLHMTTKPIKVRFSFSVKYLAGCKRFGDFPKHVQYHDIICVSKAST